MMRIIISCLLIAAAMGCATNHANSGSDEAGADSSGSVSPYKHPYCTR